MRVGCLCTEIAGHGGADEASGCHSQELPARFLHGSSIRRLDCSVRRLVRECSRVDAFAEHERCPDGPDDGGLARESELLAQAIDGFDAGAVRRRSDSRP